MELVDRSQIPEDEETAILEVRKKYLKALGRGLGLPEEFAESTAVRLLNEREELADIDYSKSERNANPEDIDRAKSVGRMYAKTLNDEIIFYDYYLGCIVLGLLKEGPESIFFTELGERVDRLTDGAGVEAFQKSLQG